MSKVTHCKPHISEETASLHPSKKEDVEVLAAVEPGGPMMMEEEPKYDDIIGAFPSEYGDA